MPSEKMRLAEQKWAKRTPAAKNFWLKQIKSADSLENYVNKVADFTGLSPSAVRAALPTKNWAEFQNRADQYVNVWMKGIRRAAEQGKWSKGYMNAYQSG